MILRHAVYITNPPSDDGRKKGLAPGVIAGLVTTILALIALAGLGGWIYLKRRRRNNVNSPANRQVDMQPDMHINPFRSSVAVAQGPDPGTLKARELGWVAFPRDEDGEQQQQNMRPHSGGTELPHYDALSIASRSRHQSLASRRQSPALSGVRRAESFGTGGATVNLDTEVPPLPPLPPSP